MYLSEPPHLALDPNRLLIFALQNETGYLLPKLTLKLKQVLLLLMKRPEFVTVLIRAQL